MTTKSEGADGPVVRVALGIRFSLFASPDKHIGEIFREDVKGAAVPRVGETLGRATLGSELHTLVGKAPSVHHVDHYIQVPGVQEWDPQCLVVSHVFNVRREDVEARKEQLEAQGWGVTLS